VDINQSQTESLFQIIAGIDNGEIMLPEFQRDFRWEIEQTYDLFDSLVREIFVGTIIYGKPSFGMTLREIDKRPRKGQGSRDPLGMKHYTTEQIKIASQAQKLRIVLDGQQRITSLYRAITGKGNDNVYIILRDNLSIDDLQQLSLEQILEEITGEESETRISVKLSDAYLAETKGFDDEDKNKLFEKSAFGKICIATQGKEDIRHTLKTYRAAMKKVVDLYKQQKMIAFYLLDMSLDKFCLFFERSNSRGIQLNFTDILAAKLYHGFNLRKKIEDFESQNSFRLNREIIVRAIAYIVAMENKGAVKIDKKYILENLDADDFNTHWDSVCTLYSQSLQYLADQHYILSQSWMPSENMIIPLMMFLRQIKSFGQMNQQQREFLQYWYWASSLANRYSTSSNETIIQDCNVLIQIAKGERISIRGYFTRLRPLITEYTDLFGYNRKASSIYRAILNLLNFCSQGLQDWKNTQKLTVSMTLEDHHIYPRAYIRNAKNLDIAKEDAEQLIDCVANRTLIPKWTNNWISKKSPSQYLGMIQVDNPELASCLKTHLITEELITDEDWDSLFKFFLEERAKQIFALIQNCTTDMAHEMIQRHATIVEADETQASVEKPRLKDLIAAGKVYVGEKVYTSKKPNDFALILDGENVDYQNQIMLINTWGQKMTGWASINIYDSVYLERTQKPLGAMRETEYSEEE
jgi:hypothetical protein